MYFRKSLTCVSVSASHPTHHEGFSFLALFSASPLQATFNLFFFFLNTTHS